MDPNGAAAAVRTSVRDLEHRTAYGRGTVAAALHSLERAGVIAVEARAGRTTRFMICDVAFGQGDGADPSDLLLAPAKRPAPARRNEQPRKPELPEVARPRSDGSGHSGARGPLIAAGQDTESGRSSSSAGNPVRIGEFGGTPIYAPPGTPVTLECDADGRWSCRVGAFLRLGPVGAADSDVDRSE